MTQEQIERGLIAIAERCGWTMLSINHKGALMGFAPLIPEMDECQWLAVPNYHNNLNAMHEAEKCLDKETNRLNESEGEETEFDGYLWNLDQVVLRKCGEESTYGGCVTATAPQRFKAMLKTIGKWEE